ncbi:MAG: four helix bundle protein [Verrucomicrobia bacterium]|nr:four helix bundle protein [Verrucomicrobiota bacterium]
MELEYARSFWDLLVYRRAFSVAKGIFEVSRFFPEEEKYALTSQIRRSSRSIGAQITEAWAKRKYERHFSSKLTDADGEQLETQHWVRVAFSCGYVEESAARSIIATLEEIGRLLHGMMEKAEAFCSVSKVAETSFFYYSADPDDPLVFQGNTQSDY